MKSVFIFLLLGLVLAGCSGPLRYKKEGTQKEFTDDCDECRQQAELGSRGNKALARKLLDQCMREKGYLRQ